jgi:hypothetical protein
MPSQIRKPVTQGLPVCGETIMRGGRDGSKSNVSLSCQRCGNTPNFPEGNHDHNRNNAKKYVTDADVMLNRTLLMDDVKLRCDVMIAGDGTEALAVLQSATTENNQSTSSCSTSICR